MAAEPQRRRIDLTDFHSGLVEIIATAFTLCAPPPKLTISEWADSYRMLSPEDSAEPGRYKTSRMEPLRGIMDAVSDPLVREIVVQKGTQVGYTAVLGNIVGYFIDRDPCPILMLMPTLSVAEEWSKNRFAPMARDTPQLRGKIKDPRSRDSGNTILSKTFPGGRLAIVGANAPSDLASRPIRVVLCDETDRYPLSAGSEGDPMTLAGKRQQTYWNRKLLKGSSPTIKGKSVIERDYSRSDKRRYHVACPHCHEHQTLEWSQVRWDKSRGEDGRNVHHPETAHYQCRECGTLWTDAERWHAITIAPRQRCPQTGELGGWRATAPFAGVAGFHLSQLYSSWVRLSDAVREFLEATGKMPGTHPSNELLKVWTNTVLAETWEDQAETVDTTGIANRGEAYGPDHLPDAALIVTVGVDVQDNRLEAQFVAWGAGEESWPCRYEVLHGDPAQATVWRDLDALLLQPLRTESGRVLRVKAAAIDTGGHHTLQVYEFCRPRLARRIYPIKGRQGPNPIWPKRASRTKTNHQVFLVGVDTGKDALYGRLKIAPRGPGEVNPGFVHFPAPNEDVGTGGFGREYFDQLTAEKVETRYREGRPYRVWVPVRPRNEALDTFVYALAARMSLPIRLRGHVPAQQSDDVTAPDAPAPVAAPPVLKKIVPAKVSAKRRVDPAAIARMFR